MSKLKRDLKTDTVANKTTRGKEITDACTGKAVLGDITDELADLIAKTTALKTTAGNLAAAQATVTGLVSQQTIDEAAFNASYEVFCLKLEGNTKGVKTDLAVSTIPTYDPGASAPTPGAIAQVTNVSVSNGDMPHELDITWNGIQPRPRLYVVRMCEDPYDQTKMVQVGMPSGSSFTKDGLLAGHKYWFEVAAVGSGNQQGPWSDPATGMSM